jgi:hypothetical protein
VAREAEAVTLPGAVGDEVVPMQVLKSHKKANYGLACSVAGQHLLTGSVVWDVDA